LRKISSRNKIELIAKAALAKKAKDVVLLDMRKLPSLCDYFIIASGDSTTQIAAIAGNIEKEISKRGCAPLHIEGRGEALWILLDCGDVVAHIFHKDTRGFYNLEKLWHDAPLRRIDDSSFRRRPRRTRKKRGPKRRGKRRKK